MMTETDFLTRDIPGPKPYGQAVFAVAPMIDWTDRREFSF
jgi:tRNA-dihydrouridine synthase A